MKQANESRRQRPPPKSSATRMSAVDKLAGVESKLHEKSQSVSKLGRKANFAIAERGSSSVEECRKEHSRESIQEHRRLFSSLIFLLGHCGTVTLHWYCTFSGSEAQCSGGAAGLHRRSVRSVEMFTSYDRRRDYNAQ